MLLTAYALQGIRGLMEWVVAFLERKEREGWVIPKREV